jgi:3-phosphoshikimate 1-carboxyvinyltransferase
MAALVSGKIDALTGETRVPGDKSISHRALMIGANAVGETRIHGLLEGDDVMATAESLRALGAEITKLPDGQGNNVWQVFGRGVGGLREPASVLDLRNSGTGARLLMGIVAAHGFTSVFTGDHSLVGRPMERIMAPLRRMGATFVGRSGGRLPLAVTGTDTPLPIVETLKVASAQLKSAILFCGLNSPGVTTVIEPSASRDHTETLLRHFTGHSVTVPADISSAAFPMVAAIIVTGSRVVFREVGLNPLRTGLLTCLEEMGAKIVATNKHFQGGEDYADLEVSSSGLKGIRVPGERAPAMIDEYPILAAAAACAEGVTRFEGVAELRVKESDRLAAIAQGLAACGVKVEEGEDWLEIHGLGKPPRGGATISTKLDHRIAMSFLVLGMASDKPVSVDDGSPIATSFPGFVPMMNKLGAKIANG